MTVRTTTFRRQLEYLRSHGHRVIPLAVLVANLNGRGPSPPPGSVVITADDGHESVFTEMLPVVREYKVPVTLFIYPSAISNAPYAMTWPQLAVLLHTGLFDIEAHTYWHPNFKVERRRLSPAAYRAFVAMQLEKPRTVLHARLGVQPTLMAWPFGIYDEELVSMARAAGYVGGVTLDRRIATARDDVLALPRFLVVDSAVGRAFRSMLPREEP
jgi:peptidoglycan/xylan/chitin deacetylase (PgdA/CDA1 family)